MPNFDLLFWQIEEIDHYACHKRAVRFENRVNHTGGKPC